jgi:hypothetical protein
MAELNYNSSGNITEEHLIDISYKDETGMSEILQSESSHMFTTDESVDQNVCSVSDKGGPS